MRIVFFNIKGGVGKTSLAVAVAKEFGIPYFTNEENKIKNFQVNLLPTSRKEISELELPKDCVFDFGGFADNIINYILVADVVVVPTIRERLSILKAMQSIKAIEQANKNIIVCMTKYLNTERDEREIQEIIEKVNQKYPYRWTYLSESRIFSDVVNGGEGGIREIGLRFCYSKSKILNQWDNFIDVINQSVKDGKK